jgi:outer membrane immunogenic protein
VGVIESLPYSWTGFYVGGNLGGAWANTELTSAANGLNWGSNQNQFTGGGQVGFNYQVRNIVLGLEGTMNWSSLDATSNVYNVAQVGLLQGSVKTDWIGTVAGRVGFAADDWLFYGKGGWAWVQGTGRLTNLTTGESASSTETLNGWVLGIGAEYAFARNWTARIEYDYIGLDTRTFWAPDGSAVKVDNDVQLLTLGINYKF